MSKTNRNIFKGAFILTSTAFFMVMSCYGQENSNMFSGSPSQIAFAKEETLETNTFMLTQAIAKKEPTGKGKTKETSTSYENTRSDEMNTLKEEIESLSIIAVGDNLIHTQVIKSGQKKDGSYDYSHLFDGIRDEIENADISIINQETILCDKKLGYTGYPKFGSPYEVGEAIHKAGFDVVLHATNHSADKGLAGVKDTIEFWKQYDDIKMVGISEGTDVKDHVAIIEKKNIKVAVLNYTYGLNGLKLPKGNEHMINLLNKKRMEKDIAYAKKNSDFVIVCPHWGTEYVYKPTQQQKDLSTFFANQGVDLVIGTHPHVLEPVEWVNSEDGKHRMLVYYSLGNFVSNQDAMARMLGGMAKFTLVRDGEEIVIKEASIEPLVTHTFYDGRQRFVTYPLQEYSESLAKNHYLNRKKKNTLTIKKLKELTNYVLGDSSFYSKIS